MKRKFKRGKGIRHKAKLGLPDLENAKSTVLVSLRSPESQRSYRHSINEFVAWYCSAPRLSFNKTVVTRYRIYLEDRQLAPGTINVRLAAVRRLAYEAADSGLLSPDLAAGIRRVKGSKKLGYRLGNWSEFSTGETSLGLHSASEKNPAGSVELGFNVANLERFHQEMTAKGVQFSMPPTKQDFGGILAQFLDSEGGRCSVAEQTSNAANQH